MQLMISVVNVDEAQAALHGGAQILDVKNPVEGSLGAQNPTVIREIKQLAGEHCQVSAAIGDMPQLPGTAALAALGAAVCGADFIKVGLYGAKTPEDAIALLREVKQATQNFPVHIIAGLYADFQRAGTLDPRFLPRIATAGGVGGCLIDTAIKDGSTLFDFLKPVEIREMAKEAHAAGLIFAVAGALGEKDLPEISGLGADVVGMRSAACRDNRRNGPLEEKRVRKLLKAITLPLPMDN